MLAAYYAPPFLDDRLTQLLILLNQTIKRQGQLLNILRRVNNNGVLAARLESLGEFGFEGVEGVLDFFAAAVFASEVDLAAAFESSFGFGGGESGVVGGGSSS